MKKMFLLSDEQGKSLRMKKMSIITTASLAQEGKINTDEALIRVIELAEEIEDILADE